MTGVKDRLAAFDAAIREVGFARNGTKWERRLSDVTLRVRVDHSPRDATVFNLDPSVLVHGAEQEWKEAGLHDGPASLRFIDERPFGPGFARWRDVAGPVDHGIFAEFERDVLPWFEGLQTNVEVLVRCRSATTWQVVLLGAALAKRLGDDAALAELLGQTKPSWETAVSAMLLRHLRGQPGALLPADQAELLRWHGEHRRASFRKGYRSSTLETRVLPAADVAFLRADVFPQDRGFLWPDGVEELAVCHEHKTLLSYLTFGFYSEIQTVVVDAAAAVEALTGLVSTDEVRGRRVHRVAAGDTPEAVKRLRTLPRRPGSAKL